MVREIVTISVGEAGINVANHTWKRYCEEHNISRDGHVEDQKSQPGIPAPIPDPEFDPTPDTPPQCFFDETKDQIFVPRNISIDLDPSTIENIKCNDTNMQQLLDPEFLLSHKEDTGGVFASGRYTLGNEIIDQFDNKLRKLSEKCDNLQGFMIHSSIVGGTGSGLGSLILDDSLPRNYRKKINFTFTSGFYNLSKACSLVEIDYDPVVAPYNALSGLNSLIEGAHASIMFDNSKIYHLCQRYLDCRFPSYDDLNGVISAAISNITVNFRFLNKNTSTNWNARNKINIVDKNMNELENNLVLLPRLHFLYTSMAPMITSRRAKWYSCSGTSRQMSPEGWYNVTEDCFDAKYFSIKLS